MNMTPFSEIIDQYGAIFFDAFGVLKNYQGLIPGVEDTLAYLDKKGTPYYILTNDASRSPDQLAESYVKRGIQNITAEKIISSGMLAREYLRHKVEKGTIAYLGTEDSAHYIEELGHIALSIGEIDLEETGFIDAMVLLDDEGFDWNTDLSKVVNLLRKRNIPVVVANTDLTYPISRSELHIAIGGIADMLERIVNKHFIRFGKPDAQMFMYAYEQLSQHVEVPKNKVLMVGDTLHTDIIGGNKFGFDTALVLSGNTLEKHVEFRMRSSGIVPTYVCESVSLYL